MLIPYQKFHLTIEAVSDLKLPYYKGSTFRGGFGNMFKKIVCALKRNECLDCILKSKCVYAYVFETPPHENAKLFNMNKYEKIPHPFVIEPPEENNGLLINDAKIYEPGSKLNFFLILIGNAIGYLPYFIYTFDELGKTGIGKGRGKYKLIEVKKLKKIELKHKTESETIYLSSNKILKKTEDDIIDIPENFIQTNKIESISLNFVTPLRIKFKRDLVVKPEFHIFTRNLLRRILLLYYFHCKNDKPSWDHKEIIKHAETITIKNSNIKWYDWERYSSRQNIRMKLGGLIGNITYYGNIEPFTPLLKAGEILHVGKGTSFGLGKYSIV